MNRIALFLLFSAIALPMRMGWAVSPPGEAQPQANVAQLNPRNIKEVVVPEISLRARANSLRMPVDSRRFLPLELGSHGVSGGDHAVEVSYVIQSPQPDGLIVEGPIQIRFDRSKSFPLKPAVIATRVGDYSLTITVRDSQSGRADSLVVSVTVIDRDESLAPILYTPNAQPSSLTLDSDQTGIRFTAQVSGSAYKPETLFLDEVDDNGKLLQQSIAKLLDDGQGQDEFRSDFVYSGTATISGGREGERYFRVRTNDRGVELFSESRAFLVTRLSFESSERQAGIVAAHPDSEVHELASPTEATTAVISGCTTDTADCQWYIEHVGAQKAWEQARVGTVPFDIALIEPFGVDGTHGELAGRCSAGNGASPCASGEHGTMVAGILAAIGNNQGIAGVAWQSPFRVYRDSLTPTDFNATLAAATERVINVSLSVGSPGDLAAVDAALDGQLLVAGAGNINKDAGICNLSGIDIYPAKHNELSAHPRRILSVGAIDINNQLAAWGSATGHCSNVADWIDIYAPGKNMYSATDPTVHPTCTAPTGRNAACYARSSGTSLATPLVAGAAAQLWSLNLSWGPEDIHDKILGRSSELSAPPLTGRRLLNFYDMLGVPTLLMSDAAPTIKSDCSDGSAFTVASANDPDLDDPIIPWDSTDQLSYSLVDAGGNSVLISGPFEIDQTTGSVSVRGANCPLDASLSPYDLTVRVADSIGMTDESTLPVNVHEASSVPLPPTLLESTAM